MKLKPTADYIVVKVDDEKKNKTAGGFEFTDEVPTFTGTILAIGNEYDDIAKVGDHVVLGFKETFQTGVDRLLVVPPKAILAIIEEE